MLFIIILRFVSHICRPNYLLPIFIFDDVDEKESNIIIKIKLDEVKF